MPKADIKMKHEAEKKSAEAEAEEHEILEAFVELELKDKEGKVIERRCWRSESFVRQWLELLYVQMNGCQWASLEVRDTGNTLRRPVTYDDSFRANALAADALYGIVAGSGNIAPTLNDYALGTKILHGIAAGQLQYSNMAVAYPAINGALSQITLTRDFANGSPGAVTVNEVGLYVWFRDDSDTARYFMGLRDVIGGGIAVPAGITLTVNYRIQAAV